MPLARQAGPKGSANRAAPLAAVGGRWCASRAPRSLPAPPRRCRRCFCRWPHRSAASGRVACGAPALCGPLSFAVAGVRRGGWAAEGHCSTVEPSWHRRARRARQRARAVIAVAQARDLLVRHHGGGGPAAGVDDESMGRNRWSRDDEGWQSRRGRSASRGRWGDTSGRGGQKRDDHGSAAKEFKKENERLRKQLEEVRRRSPQLPIAHPNAKEGPDREGDWVCGVCNFGTNRAQRPACFRCAAPKGTSFPAGSRHVAHTGAAAAACAAAASIPMPTYAAVVQSSSSTSSSSHLSPGAPAGAATHWFPSIAAPAPPPVAVPGFARSVSAAATTPAAAASPPQGAAAVKPLKGRLDALLEARTSLAANSYCAEALAHVDAQIVKARAELANAQPLEVALRGTLGAVAAARHALQRAESKATKLEQQVVAAVAAYDAAAAEAATCRLQLSGAEAATARTAGGHVDLHHFFGADPGAAWAAFRAACEARCAPGAGGVDHTLRSRAAAALAEMQSICALLPAQPPATAPAAPGTATAAPQAPPISPTSTTGEVHGTTIGQAVSAAAPLQPVAPPPRPFAASTTPSADINAASSFDAGAAAAAAITAALDLHRQQALQQHGNREADAGPPVPASPLLKPSSVTVPSQFEAVAAAAANGVPVPPTPPLPQEEPAEIVPPLPDPERQALQVCMGAAERETRSQQAIAAFTTHYKAQQEHAAAAALVQGGAAAAPLPPAPPAPLAALELAVGGEADPTAADSGHDAGTSGPPHLPAARADDSMGGGADDTIVGKRPIAALQAARAIAAKAKARV